MLLIVAGVVAEAGNPTRLRDFKARGEVRLLDFSTQRHHHTQALP